MNVATMDLGQTSIGTVTPGVKRLREATDAVIGSVFFGTMLKAMRNSNLKGPYGHGGRGEEIFGAQLHGVYAERMGVSMQGNLRESLLKRLEKQQVLMEKRMNHQLPIKNDDEGRSTPLRASSSTSETS